MGVYLLWIPPDSIPSFSPFIRTSFASLSCRALILEEHQQFLLSIINPFPWQWNARKRSHSLVIKRLFPHSSTFMCLRITLFFLYTIKYIGLKSDLISKNVTPCAPWSREDMNDAFIYRMMHLYSMVLIYDYFDMHFPWCLHLLHLCRCVYVNAQRIQ